MYVPLTFRYSFCIFLCPFQVIHLSVLQVDLSVLQVDISVLQVDLSALQVDLSVFQVDLTIEDLAKDLNLQLETYTVETTDGYIIQVYHQYMNCTDYRWVHYTGISLVHELYRLQTTDGDILTVVYKDDRHKYFYAECNGKMVDFVSLLFVNCLRC